MHTIQSHPYARFAVLASLSCGIAFAIGLAVPQVSALVAAITAVVSIRPTLHDSMQEAFRQVIGSIIGALAVLAIILVFGEFNAIALTGAVLFSFLVARLLKLGEEGAFSIAITVILIGGGNMTTEAVETRFIGVLVGLLIAVLMSLFVSSGTPTQRALKATLSLSDRLAILLSRIADRLAKRVDNVRIGAEEVTLWLNEAQSIQRDLTEVHKDAEDAMSGARWSPLMSREEAALVLAQVELTEATAEIVVGMCRNLLIGAEETQPIPTDLINRLSGMFDSLSGVISEQAESARHAPSELLGKDASPVRELHSAASNAVQSLHSMDDTAPLLLGGSLLQDAEKINRILTGKQPVPPPPT